MAHPEASPSVGNNILEHAAQLIESRNFVQSCNALQKASLLAGNIGFFKTTVIAYKARYGKASWWDANYLERSAETQSARAQALRSMKT